METTYGSKYDRAIKPQAIAKAFRAELKRAVKAGEVPAVRASVTSDYNHIRIEFNAVPEGFLVRNPERVRFERENPRTCPPGNLQMYTAEAAALLAWAEQWVNQFNRDDSDSMTDYFSVHFYLTVDFSWEVRQAELAALAAAAA